MEKAMVMMKKDLRETLRTKAFYVSVGIVIFVLVAIAAGLGRNISALIEQGTSPAEVASAIQALIGTTAFTLSLILTLLFCMYTNAYTLIMEKVKRSIESLPDISHFNSR